MKHAATLLILLSITSLGCNSATRACKSAPMTAVSPGGPSGCAVCCERQGSYQAANNNVESECRCN